MFFAVALFVAQIGGSMPVQADDQRIQLPLSTNSRAMGDTVAWCMAELRDAGLVKGGPDARYPHDLMRPCLLRETEGALAFLYQAQNMLFDNEDDLGLSIVRICLDERQEAHHRYLDHYDKSALRQASWKIARGCLDSSFKLSDEEIDARVAKALNRDLKHDLGHDSNHDSDEAGTEDSKNEDLKKRADHEAR